LRLWVSPVIHTRPRRACRRTRRSCRRFSRRQGR
jgi:hypothetical protein